MQIATSTTAPTTVPGNSDKGSTPAKPDTETGTKPAAGPAKAKPAKEKASKKEAAPAKPAKTESEQKAKEPARKARVGSIGPNKTIKVLAKECPCEKGTKRAKLWSKLKTGMSVKDAQEAGVPTKFLKNMARAEHITIG